jgi:O-antigen ligase
VVVFSVLWAVLPQEQKDRFQVVGEDRTSQQRLLYWENGIEMINQHPFLGVGYFNFIPYFEKFYPGDMLYSKAELPHNIIIQIGTDLGYIGIIVYLFLVRSSYKITRKVCFKCIYHSNKSPNFPAFFNISLLGFLVAGQFVTVGYYPFLWIHLALVVSMGNIYLKTYKWQHDKWK